MSQQSRISRFALSLFSLTALGAAACTPNDDVPDAGDAPAARDVTIERFAASRTTVQHGSLVTLTWTTKAAAGCTLTPGFGTVPRSGEVQVTPAETTTYTLACEGGGKEASADVTVTVMGGGDAGDPDAGVPDAGPAFTLSGDIEEAAPVNRLDELTDGSRIWLVPERGDALLDAELPCDIHFPASYDGDFGADEPPCVIAAGARVDSYLLHAYGPADPLIPLAGGVVFSREIVALQWRSETLARGDGSLGRAELVYPDASTRSFGVGFGDAVTLAPDRRTLTLAVEATNVDDLRVITLAEETAPRLVRSVTLVPTNATDLSPGAHQADGSAALVLERAAVLEAPLEVDVVEPGQYTSLDDARLGHALPAGTAVQGLLIHFDPASDTGGAVLVSVTVPRPLVGIAFRDQSLGASDDVVGLDSVAYPDTTNSGLELSEEEALWVSEDRRSVRARLTISSATGIDQLRVLYELEAEAETGP